MLSIYLDNMPYIVSYYNIYVYFFPKSLFVRTDSDWVAFFVSNTSNHLVNFTKLISGVTDISVWTSWMCDPQEIIYFREEPEKVFTHFMLNGTMKIRQNKVDKVVQKARINNYNLAH